MNIPIRIAGIPGIAHIHSYYAARPAQLYGPPERCYPAEDAEIEFTICDRRGRPAPWLEAKLTDKTRDQLTTHIISEVEDYAAAAREDAAIEAWEDRLYAL